MNTNELVFNATVSLKGEFHLVSLLLMMDGSRLGLIIRIAIVLYKKAHSKSQ